MNKLKLDRMEVTRNRNKQSDDPIWYDNIFSFDIETSSIFITPTGDIMAYDYDRPEDFYTTCEKCGVMYIWQFGIEYDEGTHVIYGRTWDEFMQFMEELIEAFPHNKIVYVHNLSWEFHFLQNVFSFDHVFARKPHKVLTCDTGNLHFRCSYFLVNTSLDKWAEDRDLPVKKLKGSLDYSRIRSPLTSLTPQELQYCENDILVIYEGIKLFRQKYRHIFKIPLTMTGEIRVVLDQITKNEVKYKQNNVKLLPPDLTTYRFYMAAFGGGDVHANYIHSNKLQHQVHPYDIASSYPWACISEGFMCAPPVAVQETRDLFLNNPAYHYIIIFEATYIKCKLFNTWLSFSRCQMVRGHVLDNGRVMSADYVCAVMYKWDFEMFRDFYEYETLNILEMRVAPVRPLNNEIRKYIINLYRDKTHLKGNDEKKSVYDFTKQCINGIYGDMVQRQFDDEVIYQDGSWNIRTVSDEYYMELLAKARRRGYKLYKSILTGIAIPSAARRNLWRGIISPLDSQMVYFDTDSGKFIGNDISGAVSSYNMEVYRKHARIASELGIPAGDLCPVGPDGKMYPIGIFTLDTKDPSGTCPEFKTLGAKKYAYTEKGKIKITIAGVPKSAGVKLKKVDDLTEDLVFTPKECQKNIVFYNDEQPEIIFPDGFTSTAQHGICLQPTGYSVSLSKDYAALLLANKSIYDHTLDFGIAQSGGWTDG